MKAIHTALDYQVEPIRVARAALEDTGRVLLVMATGLGKTIVSAFVVEDLLNMGYRGLFLCHSNYILEQAEGEYRKVVGNHINYKTFYGDDKDWKADQAQMLFASFQSMNNHTGAWYEVFDPDHFYFLVVDEAQHGQAPTWSAVVKYFNCQKIGMTATPDREDDLDIRDLFGEEVVNIPLEVGIVNGWLADVEYHVLSDGLSNSKLKQILKRVLKNKERVSVKQLNETIFISKRTESQRALIEEYNEIKSRSAGGKKTLIYCENIHHAEHTLSFFDNAGVVHSGRSSKDNRSALEKFRAGELQYLISVDKLNEGIDVPDTEVVAFLRATDSKRIFFQQLGRGARKFAGKTKLIVLDFVANVDRLLMLRELMERIEDEVNKDEEKKGKLTKRQFNVSGEGFEFIFSDELIDLLEVLDVLRDGFYKTYEEASEAAGKLGIRKQIEYRVLHMEDLQLPSNPNKVYSKEWVSWIHFLHREDYRDFYKTLGEASVAVQKLGINNSDEYKARYKEDPKLPSNPHTYYGSTWISWPHFFDRKRVDLYQTLDEALKAAQKLGIKSGPEYTDRCKEDPKLPRTPHNVYSLEWVSWYHFLGKEDGTRRNLYPTYQEASKAAQKLGIKTSLEYKARYKEDPKLPSNPHTYSSEWISWPNFLGKKGKERRKDVYQTYDEASKAAQKLGIRGQEDYSSIYKKNPKLPSSPQNKYPADWIGWVDFLGKEGFCSYDEASKAAQKLGIKTSLEYKSLHRKDPALVSNPKKVYKKDWVDWDDFLGRKSIEFYSTYQEASKAAQKLAILGAKNYKTDKVYKQDPKLPSNPHNYYSSTWISWPHFLGTEE